MSPDYRFEACPADRFGRRAAMDLLARVENDHPVSSWTVDSLAVWPLVRWWLMKRLSPVRETQPANDAQSPSVRRGSRVVDIGSFLRARLADREHEQDPAETVWDAAFLIDASSRRVMVDGRWYCVFSDPLIEQLESMDRRTLVLESGSRGYYRIPRYRASRLIELDLVRTAFVQRIRSRGTIARTGRFPAYDRVAAALGPRGAQALPSVPWIEGQAGLLLARAEHFKTVLERAGARAGFVVCYYGINGFAFVLACNELAIPSIDVQHGVQGPLHPAYGGWHNLPREGYALLPRYFWCWDKRDVDVIRTWSDAVPGRHVPVLGGNLWLQEWPRLEASIAQELPERRPDGQHVEILYTYDHDVDLPDNISEAMRRSPPGWRWWPRLHPSALSRREEARARLAGLTNVEFDAATDAVLPSLLASVDLHVTGCSTVTLEAQAAGVPTIITSPLGEEYYEEQIGSGWVSAAFTADEILDAVRAFLVHPQRPAQTRRNDVDTAATARQVLEAILS